MRARKENCSGSERQLPARFFIAMLQASLEHPAALDDLIKGEDLYQMQRDDEYGRFYKSQWIRAIQDRA